MSDKFFVIRPIHLMFIKLSPKIRWSIKEKIKVKMVASHPTKFRNVIKQLGCDSAWRLSHFFFFSLSFPFLGSSGDQTQHFMHIKQALYHMSHS